MPRYGSLPAFGLLLALLPAGAQVPAAPKYEVYAVEYAVLPGFPVSALVSGADKDRKLDIAMLVWVVRGSGRTVLFDSGFYRKKFLKEWKPRNFAKPSEAVARLGIEPAEVTDVIISHAHWDHTDGADLFPKATIWIQKDEYQYYTGEAWQAEGTHGGIEAEDMQALLKANTAGRLRFVNGDDQEVLPGVRCYIGAKHTWQSQYCAVQTRSGTVVLASDNMYLYENLEKHAAIAQTLDAAANLRAQDRMKGLATKPELIVPGHDPAQLRRFPKVAEGVVRID
jgi:glyoxylase-like metal-dependent hydrolase (beta-lactamase superfamily II)